MKLDTFLKSKVRWHLGYNTTSIPAGDLARLEEALDNVPDSFWYSKIVEQAERCDEAEKRTDMTGTMNNSTVPRGRVESIAGDVDRTIATTDFKETLKTWTQTYMYETDRLALHLLYLITEILSKLVTGLTGKVRNLSTLPGCYVAVGNSPPSRNQPPLKRCLFLSSERLSTGRL